jgi:hypothetical protein
MAETCFGSCPVLVLISSGWLLLVHFRDARMTDDLGRKLPRTDNQGDGVFQSEIANRIFVFLALLLFTQTFRKESRPPPIEP